MAFQKLIGHFYVAVACRGLARPGTVLQALHCSTSPGGPPPPPREGPAQDSRESGRAWGEPGSGCRAPRGRGAVWGQRRAGGGTRPEPRALPRDFPAGPEPREPWRSSVDLPCHPWLTAADLSLLLKGSLLVHASRVGSSLCSLPPSS